MKIRSAFIQTIMGRVSYKRSSKNAKKILRTGDGMMTFFGYIIVYGIVGLVLGVSSVFIVTNDELKKGTSIPKSVYFTLFIVTMLLWPAFILAAALLALFTFSHWLLTR